MTDNELPDLKTAVPGPKSAELAEQLRRYECRGVTYTDESFPVFWESARGANIVDVDGNRYVDVTGAFAVASLGHGDPLVVEAGSLGLARLSHGMGDVHPSAAKVELAKLLDEVTPGDLGQVIFGSSGSEAVEAALKTATQATGKSHFLAFEGAYHGLAYGALCLTHRPDFREPFLDQLGIPVTHLPFPDLFRPPPGSDRATCGKFCLEKVEEALREDAEVAGIIVEPILGRGGEVVPPEDFLPGLRALCDAHGVLLIADEIFTGFCRTGRWFAVEHWEVLPDLMCVGKAMSNGFPISACVGRRHTMDAWDESAGEAIHTSTFLGHPIGCAMGVAAIREMQRHNLAEVAAAKGERLLEMLRPLQDRHERVGDIRGLGLMIGIELVRDKETREPDPDAAWRVVVRALKRGLVLLSGGSRRNVLSLSPPLTISEDQLLFSVQAIDECLGELP